MIGPSSGAWGTLGDLRHRRDRLALVAIFLLPLYTAI